MSKDSVADWSTTASDNTDVGGIAVTNTQTADKIDDIVREVMAQVATAVADNTLYTPDAVSSATTSAQGIVELATVAEALAGTDAVRAVTPSGLHYAPGTLFGCTLSNNVSDATNDIDIAAGTLRDSSDVRDIVIPSSMGKQLDANWTAGGTPGATVGGRYSGAAIANTTYHVWAVAQALGANPDIYFDPSAVPATVLGHLQAETGGSAYLYVRRIGSIIRSGGAILAFHQYGDRFVWDTPIVDVNATAPGTSAVSRTLSVPAGFKMLANVMVGWFPGSTFSTVYLSSLDGVDLAPQVYNTASLAAPVDVSNGASGTYWYTVIKDLMTNASSQIRSRASSSGASDRLGIITYGWTDTRGRIL